MIIDFKEVRHLIPGFIFNEYGQLTGNYVYADRIVCVAENGRIKIWLDKDAFEAQDPERLICDYDERTLRGLPPDAPLQSGGKILKSEDQWKSELTPEQFKVCRKKGTEQPFTGEHYNNKEEGLYKCVCCGNDLFSSQTKYESGTGWPSFWAPLSSDNVKTDADDSLFMRRTEVLCSKCDSHLGHVFEDGPAPTHLRYCINSVALKFEKKQ